MILIDTQKEEFTKLKDIRIFEKLDNEQRYNGDLLVIGLGGMGSQVVCDMKGMLMGEITPDDNIQYLMVDSDIPAMENMIEASQVGTGDRSEKIRTYNFPQGRVTDHRIGLTLYKLDKIMNGDIQEIIDACIAADQAAKLAKMNEE